MWAEITRPLADGITDTVNLTLKDDGVVTDIIKDDGIYSGNFFQFSDKGRYSIKGEFSIWNLTPTPISIPFFSVLGSGNNGKASISKGHMVGVGKMDDAEYDMLG